MRHLMILGTEATPRLHTELFRSIHATMEWAVQRQINAGNRNISQGYYYAFGYAMQQAANAMPNRLSDTLREDLCSEPELLREWSWRHAEEWAKPIFLVKIPSTGNHWVPNRALISSWLKDRAEFSGQHSILSNPDWYKQRQNWLDTPPVDFVRHVRGGTPEEGLPSPHPSQLVHWSNLVHDYDWIGRRGRLRLGTHVQNLHTLELS